MSDIVYKLKHVPTGMYYQPVKGRFRHDKTNLSVRGKIYSTQSFPKLKNIHINITESQSKKIEGFKQNMWKEFIIETKPEDWKVISYNLVEVKL